MSLVKVEKLDYLDSVKIKEVHHDFDCTSFTGLREFLTFLNRYESLAVYPFGNDYGDEDPLIRPEDSQFAKIRKDILSEAFYINSNNVDIWNKIIDILENNPDFYIDWSY